MVWNFIEVPSKTNFGYSQKSHILTCVKQRLNLIDQVCPIYTFK